jgi:hypothetical protein
MQTFIGTKVVEAETEERDGVLGYKVVYPDGYVSWSPPEAFEEAYRLSGEMNFGHALELLKRGHKVARAGWNGKGMFLYYVAAASYPAARNPKGTMIGVFPDDMVPYQAYIAMKTAQDTVVPWLCSQTDALAEDWCVVA